jgi:hypothetical protein
MTLRTRKPTGAVPWPVILLEGGEKSGKSYTAALLSASPKVGRTVWLDLNEGAADEYGKIPGARYEVIEHDGTWPSIIGQVADAKEEAAKAAEAGEMPLVLVIDSMTAEWDMLKDWADHRARNTDANRAKLARDPNAEIQVTMNLWNDANSRHRKLMTILMTFPGIVIITARGKDVAAMDAKGRPVEGTKEYRVEGNKNLAFDASCWVRMFRDKPAVVVGARSVHAGVRPGKDKPKELDPDWTLEWLIFEKLQCDPKAAHVRNLAELQPEMTPEQIRDEALQSTTDFSRIRELHAIARGAYPEYVLENETGDQEKLTGLLFRIGNERRGTPARPVAARAAAVPAAAPAAAPASEAEWVRQFEARLADSAGQAAFRQRRSEIELAAAKQEISRTTADDLLVLTGAHEHPEADAA